MNINVSKTLTIGQLNLNKTQFSVIGNFIKKLFGYNQYFKLENIENYIDKVHNPGNKCHTNYAGILVYDFYKHINIKDFRNAQKMSDKIWIAIFNEFGRNGFDLTVKSYTLSNDKSEELILSIDNKRVHGKLKDFISGGIHEYPKTSRVDTENHCTYDFIFEYGSKWYYLLSDDNLVEFEYNKIVKMINAMNCNYMVIKSISGEIKLKKPQ